MPSLSLVEPHLAALLVSAPSAEHEATERSLAAYGNRDPILPSERRVRPLHLEGDATPTNAWQEIQHIMQQRSAPEEVETLGQEDALMKFARVVFTVAGVYGLIVLLPQYFLIEKNGLDFPPAITHTEYYYGFIGVAVAWQLAFLVFAKNPVPYRPLMLPAIIEKAAFGLPACILYMRGRLNVSLFAAGIIDLVLGLMFAVAYCLTPSE